MSAPMQSPSIIDLDREVLVAIQHALDRKPEGAWNPTLQAIHNQRLALKVIANYRQKIAETLLIDDFLWLAQRVAFSEMDTSGTSLVISDSSAEASEIVHDLRCAFEKARRSLFHHYRGLYVSENEE